MPPTSPNQAAVDSTSCTEPTEANVLAVFIAAGADPQRLAQWMHRNTDTCTSLETLTTIGEVLRCGTQGGVGNGPVGA